MNPPWSTHPERPMNEWLTLLVEAESILGAHRLAAIFTGPWLVPVRVSLAAWRCCSSVRHEGYERLIVALHHGVMALTPEQHPQIAAVYDKCRSRLYGASATAGSVCPQGRDVSPACSLGSQAKIGPASKSFRPCQRECQHTEQSRNGLIGATPICVAATPVAWRCSPLCVSPHQESAPWRFQHHADRRGHRHTRATGRWRQPPSTPPVSS